MTLSVAHHTDLSNPELIFPQNSFESFFEQYQKSGILPFARLFENMPSILEPSESPQTPAESLLNREYRRRAKKLGLTEKQFSEALQVVTSQDAPQEKPAETLSSMVRAPELIQAELSLQFKESLESLMSLADSGASPRQLEEETLQAILPLGRAVLGQLLARRCAQVSEAEIKRQQLLPKSFSLRMDKDYSITLTTTLGDICIPLFAFRIRGPGGKLITHTPARAQLFPYHKQCHSSELCLEWETRFGSQQTFRESESSIAFFSHGAMSLSDNAIAVHTVKVGSIINRDYLYRSPAEIKEILVTRATRSRKTGRPLIYFSTDAHALRRYIDETWHGAWKMANGLRIWCVDKDTNQIIHLGGEYTWGDCEAVEEIFKTLTRSGYLPADGNYGDDVQAQYVIISDGACWIEKRIVPIFPDSCAILDAYHALETLSKYLKEIFGSETAEAHAFYRRSVYLLLGESQKKEPKIKIRKGNKKTRKDILRVVQLVPVESEQVDFCEEESSDGIPSQIQEFIDDINAISIPEKKESNRQNLIDFLNGNSHRIDFLKYRKLGYQIGSGAMESLHRTASQLRLKIPGATWLQETAHAIFNIRMMTLVGNSRKFWNQPNMSELLKSAFLGKSEMVVA